jgi:hypothetical protein
MYWGSGSALGFLSLLGYAFFATGAVLLWYNRLEVPTWVNDEVGAIRRSLTRHAVAGGFAGLREETRLKLAPSGFLRQLGRLPRRQINRGAILLAVGMALFLMDFFI